MAKNRCKKRSKHGHPHSRVNVKKVIRLVKQMRSEKQKLKKVKTHISKRGSSESPILAAQISNRVDSVQKLQKESRERRQLAVIQNRQNIKKKISESKGSILDIHKYIADAQRRAGEFERTQSKTSDHKITFSDRTAKTYYKEFSKVVEAADVVLEVLDARDPLGTRCSKMESVVTNQHGKRLVLILNKADLVPRENLEKWTAYLRKEHPTVVFKASTQKQASSLSQFSGNSMNSKNFKSSGCLGADVLMQLLKNYSRKHDIKVAITVGVVGVPNVGKSSIINSLKRSRACVVGSKPGVTRNLQEVLLDSKVRLLDCPGVVLPSEDVSEATAALRNAVKVENLTDPIRPVEAIMSKTSKTLMMQHYKLPEFKDTNEFLALLGLRQGKLKRGGIPDIEATARSVLLDWNSGSIKYYTEPPKGDDAQVGSAILSRMADEFDLDSFKSDEVTLFSSLAHKEGQDLDGQENNMEVDGMEFEESEGIESTAEVANALSGAVVIDMDSTEKKDEESNSLQQVTSSAFDPYMMSFKKFLKKREKKLRKERNRNVRRANDLTLAFENFNAFETKEEFDGSTYKVAFNSF